RVGFAVDLAGDGGRDDHRTRGDGDGHVVLPDVAGVDRGDGDAVETGVLHRGDALVQLLAARRGDAAVGERVRYRRVTGHGVDVGDDHGCERLAGVGEEALVRDVEDDRGADDLAGRAGCAAHVEDVVGGVG